MSVSVVRKSHSKVDFWKSNDLASLISFGLDVLFCRPPTRVYLDLLPTKQHHFQKQQKNKIKSNQTDGINLTRPEHTLWRNVSEKSK